MLRQDWVLFFRSTVYVILLSILSYYQSYFLLDSTPDQLKIALLLVAGMMALQALLVRWNLNTDTLLSFIVSDVAFTWYLVKVTGASASPFTIMFALVSLSAAIIYQGLWRPLLVSILCLTAMLSSVGFGASVLGNGMAIIATGALGYYLNRALSDTSQALKKSEGARRRLENLQRIIISSIPSGLMSIDANGRVIQVNKVGAKILAKSEHEILNEPIEKVLPAIREELDKLTTSHPAESSFDSNYERRALKYENPSGQMLSLGFSVSRLVDPEEREFLGGLVVFQDLTEISKLEESLRISEKLAAIGKLAAGIAHEIRNPLAGISGSAQLLSGLADSLNEEDQKLLAIIQRESARLDSLIGEFLEYVRPQKPKLDKVDLVKVCQNLSESLKVSPKWQSLGTELRLNFEGLENLIVEGDANKMTQVLLNLCINAGQAGAKIVEVRIQRSKSPTLRILDNGAGIAPNHQARLFEPFFTTKEGGTGLGLAISYRALEGMGASIRVKSPIPEFAPNGGTSFTIEFKGAA